MAFGMFPIQGDLPYLVTFHKLLILSMAPFSHLKTGIFIDLVIQHVACKVSDIKQRVNE